MNYIEGGAGIDILVGGAGTDTLGYATAGGGVQVTLVAGGTGIVTGAAGADLVSLFENVVGSNFDDTIHGDTAVNVLAGLDGNDELHGHGNNDTLIGGAGNDLLYGDTGNDTLRGGTGADQFFGGDGTDTADYSTATGYVEIRLAATNSSGDAVGDKFNSIETVIGTNFDDTTVTAAAGSFTLYGGSGADHLIGAATVSSVLVGGAGQDLLDHIGAGVATFKYLAPNDFAVNDTIGGFAHGDKIDLSAIDADPNTPGDQAFHIGSGVGGISIDRYNDITFADYNGSINVSTAQFPMPDERFQLTAVDFIL